MEPYNLKTATTYINNLLLARGLLRNGSPIEFAHPSRAEGGKEATMAQIINLVHDLILKRDRDQEYRESMADTLRSHRAESTRQTLALEKLHTRNADLSRQLSLAQAQEQSARKALQTAESSARKLRAEMQRLKTTVDQVRTSCTNDVRKRDREIQRLKAHLTSQQRGNKTGLVGASITINPASLALPASTTTRPASDNAPDVDDAEYSLKQETTAFLTQLSQSLSDENDSLIGLVRNTLMTLRELQGMPDQSPRGDAEGLSIIGEEDEHTQQGMMHALPTDYDSLATDMDTVLDNLKNLLTNPNFVAVDEVEMREEEILRLRAGWEKMEARMREAFMLMDSWRKRMTNGDTINLDELKMGFSFGLDLDNDQGEEASMDEDEEAVEDGSSIFDDEVDENHDEEADGNHDEEVDEDADEGSAVEALPSPEQDSQQKNSSEMFKLKLQPNPPALRETHGNVSPSRSPRKVAFSASIPNTPSQAENENAQASGIDLVGSEKPSRATSATKAPQSQKGAAKSRARDDRTPRHTKKRLSNEAHPDEPSPKLTVQDKLRAVQAEAESAAVRAASPVKKVGDQGHAAEPRSAKRPPRSPMKTRVGGRPRRRKSTLTPEELESLFMMG